MVDARGGGLELFAECYEEYKAFWDSDIDYGYYPNEEGFDLDDCEQEEITYQHQDTTGTSQEESFDGDETF